MEGLVLLILSIVFYITTGVLIEKSKKKHNLQEFYLKEIRGAKK